MNATENDLPAATATEAIFIREATIQDAAAVAALMTQANYPTAPDEMRRRLQPILAHPEYYTLLAELDDRVVGLIGVSMGLQYDRNERFGRVLALVVDRQLRTRGIGEALLERGEKWLIRQGAGSAVVLVRVGGDDALQFYRTRGFEENGTRLFKTLAAPGTGAGRDGVASEVGSHE